MRSTRSQVMTVPARYISGTLARSAGSALQQVGRAAENPITPRRRTRGLLSANCAPEHWACVPLFTFWSHYVHLRERGRRKEELRLSLSWQRLSVLSLFALLSDGTEIARVIWRKSGLDRATYRLLLSVVCKHPSPGERLKQIPLCARGEDPRRENAKDLNTSGHERAQQGAPLRFCKRSVNSCPRRNGENTLSEYPPD